MKSNSAVPGGSLTSKPTWLNTAGYSVTSAFFVFGDAAPLQPRRGIRWRSWGRPSEEGMRQTLLEEGV